MIDTIDMIDVIDMIDKTNDMNETDKRQTVSTHTSQPFIENDQEYFSKKGGTRMLKGYVFLRVLQEDGERQRRAREPLG